MKIGVVSDTHIPVVAPSVPGVVLEVFSKERVSLIMHAGDVVSEEGLYDLMAIAPVRAVAGNMDLPSIGSSYPDVDIFDVEGVRFLLTHGWGDPHTLPERILKTYRDRDVQVMVFGHSHRPFNQVVDGILLFNPGTPTDTYYAPRRSFGLLEVKEGSVSGSIIYLD